MDKTEHQPRTHLFMVRVWLEQLGEGKTEWRGEVQYVVNGERRYFRDWPTLVGFLHEMLPTAGSVRPQVGPLSETKQTGGHCTSTDENAA